MDGKALEGFLGAMMVDFHKHLVYPTNIWSKCYACSSFEQRDSSLGGYTCKRCNFYVHKGCLRIQSLDRHKHPLKLLEYVNLHDFYKKCLCCEKGVYEQLFYHCLICDFTLCTVCTSSPLVIDPPKKVHEHSVTQVMKTVSFTCDACGDDGHGFPCICLQCCFIIHKDCLKLPHIIHINRHDHRVSHTYLLGPGDWICGVCRKAINRPHGAYSCSTCRYAVHANCATRRDVWDGKELEDVPEDDNEDLDPFEVISEGLIKHFSHEHDLRLIIKGNTEHCYACTLPIYYEPYYSCVQCHFILHKSCANFPRRKRHELHHSPFILYPNPKPGETPLFFFTCYACNRLSTGFRYHSGHVDLDVRCATISDKFLHESHPHSLSIPSLLGGSRMCSACDQKAYRILSCVECISFFLCFKCATIPKEVFHKYDKHTLYLRCNGDLYGNYWCDICEEPTNPNKWFYSCEICGSTLHIDCALGTQPYMKPGYSFLFSSREFQIVSNNHISRPFCKECSLRCVDAFVLKSKNKTDMSYFCSISHMLQSVFVIPQFP